MRKTTKVITLILIIIMWLTISVAYSKEDETSPVEELQNIVLPKIEVAEPETELNIMEVTATAYCPCKECSGPWGTSTATGAIAKEGRTIAVDPTVIPYGTEVIIDGNTYVAEDTGGAIRGNMIDIYFENHEETTLWGRRKIEIIISESV